MKAIVNTGVNQVEWRDWPMPEPKTGQVRIRTGACGICATDIEMIAGWTRTGFPAVPGHEWAGFVDAVGPGGDAGLVGKKCVAENVLSDGGEVGFEHQGGYAQYLITEAKNVYPLPANFPIAHAAMVEPLAVCVRGLARMRMENTESALVLGDGPIGQLMVMLLKARKVERVALVGGRPGRLALAESLGADATLNYHEVKGDLAKSVVEKFGEKFPNVVEATGSPQAAESMFDMVRNLGKILVIGDYAHHHAGFLWNTLLHRELELIGSNASAGAWPEAVKMAASGAVPLGRLVTHRLPAEKFADGIAMTQSRAGDLVKVVLEWGGE